MPIHRKLTVLWIAIGAVWAVFTFTPVQWYLDKLYGDEAYKWLQKNIHPRVKAIAGLLSPWVADHWTGINLTALVIYVGWVVWKVAYSDGKSTTPVSVSRGNEGAQSGPVLELVFDRSCRTCVEDHYSAESHQRRRTLRVGIRNSGTKTAREVKLMLSQMTDPEWHRLPLPAQLGGTLDVHPSGSTPHDHILVCTRVDKSIRVTFHLSSGDGGPSRFHYRNYEGVFIIRHADGEPIVRRFRLAPDDNDARGRDILHFLSPNEGTWQYVEVDGSTWDYPRVLRLPDAEKVKLKRRNPDLWRSFMEETSRRMGVPSGDVFFLRDGRAITRAEINGMDEDGRIAFAATEPEAYDQYMHGHPF